MFQIVISQAIKCGSIERKFKEITTNENDNDEFKKLMKSSIDLLQNHYNAQMKKSSSTHRTGFNKKSDMRQNIIIIEANGMEDIQKKITEGTISAEQFFGDENAKNIDYIHKHIRSFCNNLEYSLRIVVARADYENTVTVAKRNDTNIVDFTPIKRSPNVEKFLKLAVNGQNGNTAKTMFRAGYKSIRNIINDQLNEYKKQIDKSMKKLTARFGESSIRTKIVQADWKKVQDDEQRVLKMIDDKNQLLRTYNTNLNDKSTKEVIDFVLSQIDCTLNTLNQETISLFGSMLVLEYDAMK